MRTALLLVDIQNDYFPGGNMELPGIMRVGAKAKQILSWFRENQWPVFHVQHVSLKEGAKAFGAGTVGAEIHNGVCPLDDEPVIQKNRINCFRDTPLLNMLREKGITHLVIAGMMTHMCIHAAARAAADLGFHCTVISDAGATKDMSFEGETIPANIVHQAFLGALAQGGYAKVCKTEELLKENFEG